MRNVFGWARIRSRRRWVLALIGGALGVGLVLYLLPGRNQGIGLTLTALGADGHFAESISIPRHWAHTDNLEPGAVIRVPLVLAVRNNGSRDVPPTRLELNLPTRYRLTRANGQPLPAYFSPGTPLVRYSIPVPAMPASAGSIAGYTPVLDTVWLEPIIPSFYCIALSDSVPDFVPSPPAPVEAIARVRIFYSFTGEELRDRQTGLLAIQLDPTLLELETPAPPPVFPTEYHDPVAPRPNLSEIIYKGSRQSYCGDVQDPIEIMSTLWETPAGGRLFVLYYGGAPRKYLYDLNRDSIIELELWDASGSGHFNARRQAQLPIPPFLLPPSPAAPSIDGSIYAALPPEQLLALDRFGRAQAMPYRFQNRPSTKEPRRDRFRPGVIGSEEMSERWPDLISTSPASRPPPYLDGQRQTDRHPTTPGAPPILGRPLTTPPGAATVSPPPTTHPGGQAETRQPDRQREEKPKDKTQQEKQPEKQPDPTAKPTPPKPTESPPRVLGVPLDSIPKRLPPDSTSGR